jgi:hypothetical protein
MAERAIELDQQPADRRIEERRAAGGGEIARQGEGAGVVAAMGGEEAR